MSDNTKAVVTVAEMVAVSFVCNSVFQFGGKENDRNSTRRNEAAARTIRAKRPMRGDPIVDL
jgi:hypothetical protein